MLGLGTADSLGAADASQQAAEAQIQQAYEDTARVVARLQQQLASLDRQQQNTGTLAAQAKRNYTLFQEQYEAGQRQVMDVVNVYEGMVDSQLEHVGLRYDAILTRLSIANEYGLLVNGDAV
jgi:adhesin transport system outer membrane protein